MSDIRWEIDAVLQRWFDAYPVSVFPQPKRPPLPEETAYAVMLARHILQSLSVEIEGIFMDHEAKETNT